MSTTSTPARQIADYALIGDCETAALVSRAGAIEWLCWPRFDSEACMASLLGTAENGHWQIAATAIDARLSRRYLGDSLILETRVETTTGTARLIDFMPARGEASDVVRIVVGEQGEVAFKSELRLRFDYGRLRPRWLRRGSGTAVAIAGPHAVRLMADAPVTCLDHGDCESSFSVAAGERLAFVLTYSVSHEAPPAEIDAERALSDTLRFWRDWSERCAYEGPWREAVIRSLITMKALTYRPSGAIVAAPSSSLPERPGGKRNWDYRFCWLRDATFTLLAFLQADYKDEARAWRDWLLRAVGGDPERIQPAYGLGGEARLMEWDADWLDGFNGASPVRFGNVAFRQRQFDVYGEIIDALHQAHAYGLPADEDAWRLAAAMVSHLEKVWRQPDDGIWETRGAAKRFTYSQAMIWASLDRVIRRAEVTPMNVPLASWRRLRDQIHTEVCERGFDETQNSFVRDFDSRVLDASLLLLPQIGFLPPDDPRIIGTLDAVGANLSRNGFVFRWAPEVTSGGAPESQSAFLACSFWYADALAMAGRREEAKAVFEQVLAVRNDLGLLSEEFDLGKGALVGNFPQTLSHLALVNTAFNLADGRSTHRSRGAGEAQEEHPT